MVFFEKDGFKSLSLKKRIVYISIAMLTVFYILLILMLIFNMQSFSSLENVANASNKGLRETNRATMLFKSIRVNLRDQIFDYENTAVYIENILVNAPILNYTLQDLYNISPSTQIKTQIEEITNDLEIFYDVGNRISHNALERNFDEAVYILLIECHPVANRIAVNLRNLSTLYETHSFDMLVKIKNTGFRTMLMFILLSIPAAFLFLFFAWYTIKEAILPFDKITKEIQKLAVGNFKFKELQHNFKYEAKIVWNSLINAVDKLGETISSINETTDLVGRSVSSINNIANKIKGNAEHISGVSIEVSESVEDVSETLELSLSKSKKANQVNMNLINALSEMLDKLKAANANESGENASVKAELVIYTEKLLLCLGDDTASRNGTEMELYKAIKALNYVNRRMLEFSDISKMQYSDSEAIKNLIFSIERKMSLLCSQLASFVLS